MWGARLPILPRNIDLARPGGERQPSSRRCRCSRSPYRTGAGTCCSPTTHGCSIERAFPPSQAIAEEIPLRGRLSTGGPANVQLSWCFSRGAVGATVPALPGPGCELQRTGQWLRDLPAKWRGSGVHLLRVRLLRDLCGTEWKAKLHVW
jgi:hypothetical protein